MKLHTNDAQRLNDFLLSLDELATVLELANENPFRIQAYKKAAVALKGELPSVFIDDLVSGKKKIPGVGAGILALLSEFQTTGSLAVLNEARAQIPKVLLELVEIPGLGPKKARQLIEALSLQSMAELEYACRENRLLGLKGFGEKMQTSILNGIQKLRQRAQWMRLDEACEVFDLLATQLKNGLGSDVGLKPFGDFAKRHEKLKNVTVAVRGGLLEQVAEVLENRNGLESLEFKDKRWVDGVLHCQLAGRSCEIHADTSPLRSDPSYLWSEPENEERLNAIKMAPSTLIKRYYSVKNFGHVRGVFHCHTTESDGAASLEELVEAARARKLEYIGIADHSVSAFYAQGLSVERIVQQAEHIRKLNNIYKDIYIFHGIEADILADGSLDYDSEVLRKFDFVIGSIHSRFKMDAEAMTDRLERALKNPFITMWGHPSGRLVNGRDPYVFDVERVLTCAAKQGVIIELNANPHRLDIDWRYGGLLERLGLSISINPDAHSIEGLADTIYGEWMAEKALLPTSQVFNLKTLDEVKAYFDEKKRKN